PWRGGECCRRGSFVAEPTDPTRGRLSSTDTRRRSRRHLTVTPSTTRRTGDHREEGIAIALELGGADAAQAAERLAVARAEAGHLDQRAVVKDDIGRSAVPRP